MKSAQTAKISLYHWILFVICFLSIGFGGIVSTLMSIYLPRVIGELAQNNQAEAAGIGAYINAAFVFGWALGGFAWGIIGDKTGRKKATIYSVGFYGIFTVLTGLMHSWWAIVFCRFASGFGMGGVLVATTTIMIEEWNEKSKAVFMGILSISMPVGIFSAGWITNGVSSWRDGFLIGVIPVGIALASSWLLQESEKWKSGRALKLTGEKIGSAIFTREHKKNLWVGSVIFGSMLIGLWAIFSWLPTWLQGLIASQNGGEKIGSVMMIFGAGGLTGGFLSGWILNLIGSRKSMLLCFAACSICSFLLFKTNSSFNPFIYPEIVGIAVFFGVSQGVLSVYIPELFPVPIRATATGFCFNIGRLFTATAVLFVGLLQSILGGYGNALFIFSFVFIIGLVTTLFSSADRKTRGELSLLKAEQNAIS